MQIPQHRLNLHLQQADLFIVRPVFLESRKAGMPLQQGREVGIEMLSALIHIGTKDPVLAKLN